MSIIGQIIEIFWRWIDSIALTITSLFDRVGSRREVQLIEEESDQFRLHAVGHDGKLKVPDHSVRIVQGSVAGPLPEKWATILRGSRIEIVLKSARFLFQPLELPKRAAEFLDGIVRTQIDRLTPWSAVDAVYGWTPPIDIANDRIVLVITATARATVAPYVQAMADLGAKAVAVATTAPGDEANAPHLNVFEHKAASVIDVRRIRQALVTVFLVSGLAAVASVGVSAVVSDNLDTERQQLQHRIAERRAAMRLGSDGSGGTGQAVLEHRKQTTPSSVIVLEALSKLLPDHTYVTELRIEGDKVQVVGITHDAPSLIQLLEQSPYFTRATFFAPTTRSPEDPGERFHVEARIKPYFS